jgi:hypothetical protein
MPLEPIDEKDLDLKNKFVEKKSEEGVAEGISVEKSIASVPDQKVERQEGLVEKDDAYAKIVSKIKTTSPQLDDSQVKSDAHAVSKEMDVESRVKNLVDVAMQKGVVHAVNVARHIDDNYILDKFHDKMMADELHDALLEKGLIKDL